MTLEEVKDYYGKSYKKIIDCLSIFDDVYEYSVDKGCGKYLELTCVNDKQKRYLKVNHGISNKYPYNVWYKRGAFENVKWQHFHNQNEVAGFIKEIFGGRIYRL